MTSYTGEVATFSAWDYVVFVTVLLISAAIGLFHACTGGRQKSTQEFLMANRSMSALPVALSVLASFFSASTLLGRTSIQIRGETRTYQPGLHLDTMKRNKLLWPVNVLVTLVYRGLGSLNATVQQCTAAVNSVMHPWP